MKEIINTIEKEIKNVQNGVFLKKNIFKTSLKEEYKNEFLFFVKPEITLADDRIQLSKILNLIFDKLGEYQLNIKEINILSAKYLDQNNIVAQHYGIINQLSQNPKKYLSETAVSEFKKLYGISINEVNLKGSLELMKENPTLTVEKLEQLVAGIDIQKLAGGTYVQKIRVNATDKDFTYVINSFHPKQLMHFIQEKRSIITFTVAGNTDWKQARTELIGSTNPPAAKDGSIRKELLNQIKTFGLEDVCYSLNGVHLSAGAIEGLLELIRFNTDFENNRKPEMDEFRIGKLLKQNFNKSQIDRILANENFDYNGKTQSVFDITEEKNADEAIEILKTLV